MPTAEDWYANLVWIERRKCLLLAHVRTLFSVFQPDVSKSDLLELGPFIVTLIERELRSEGLPLDTFGLLVPEALVIARTADRSVLGSMNEMAYASRMDVMLHGGLARCDFATLNRGLRRDIHSPRGYARPIDLAKGGRPDLQVLSGRADETRSIGAPVPAPLRCNRPGQATIET